jgi:hypothetical protein
MRSGFAVKIIKKPEDKSLYSCEKCINALLIKQVKAEEKTKA